MTTMYLMHKVTGEVGIADLPDWVNFDEKPPRSFDITWASFPRFSLCYTSAVVPITKAVYDIVKEV